MIKSIAFINPKIPDGGLPSLINKTNTLVLFLACTLGFLDTPKSSENLTISAHTTGPAHIATQSSALKTNKIAAFESTAAQSSTHKIPLLANLGHEKLISRQDHSPSTDQESAKNKLQTSIPLTNTAPPPEIITQVKAGESLASIFDRLSLNKADLHPLVMASPNKHYFRRIKPGQTLHFTLSQDKHIDKLVIQQSLMENARFTRNNNIFHYDTVTNVKGTQVKFASAKIENSLYLAAKKANLDNKLIMALTDIFAWDIDFTQDIRVGDTFEVLYEEWILDDNRTIPNKILVAKFVNRHKPYTAIEFTDENNISRYYSEDGLSIEKTFLRTPVDFARISSHFNLKRKHPILHTIRAHKGVDYAAKTGTPIKATADGKISFIGRKGGYGNTIILEHPNNITTLYAHMHKFSNKLKKGARVKQGDIIGQVGSTGYSTGPHLHYEFRVNGRHKNPVTVKLPKAKPIMVKNKVKFQQKSQQMLSQLKHRGQQQLLAEFDSGSKPETPSL